MQVPALPESLQSELRRILPSFAATGNPVDLTPQVSPSAIPDAVRAILGCESVSGAVGVNVGLDLPEFAEGLIQAAQAHGKALVAFTADAPEVTRRFTEAGVPVLPTPERAVRAYRALFLAGRRRSLSTFSADLPVLPPELQELLASGQGALPYQDTRRILESLGIPFCREEWADSADEAVEAAKRLGFPVVVKAVRDDLLHKTESGAVQMHVRDPHAVSLACRLLAARVGPARFLIQEQVEPGVELLMGGRQDPTFGPLVAVGTGGVLAEAVQDVSFGLVPVDSEEAREMLAAGLRVRLLRGYRGMPACDEGPLVRILLTLGRLLLAYPRIAELDLNPVIARGGSAVAVDALIILGYNAP